MNKIPLCQPVAAVLLLAATRLLPAAELGDPAAPLDISEWVKGDAVDLAAVKGRKILVVEFWATWCSPCRVSIPHLTEMQKQFKDQGVVFIGVSDETPEKVKPFVDGMGEKMDYTVALDRDRKTSEGYMKAYGQNGIPHAFIVDAEGRIAWHGHPMAGLDKALEQVIKRTPVTASSGGGETVALNSPEQLRRAEAQRKLQEYTDRAARGESGADMDRLGQQLTALDREIGGFDPGKPLDLANVRKEARFQSLLRDYRRAVASGRSEAELQKIQQLATPLAPPGFGFEDFRGKFGLQRIFQDYYRAATGSGDPTKAAELANRLGSVESANVELLNEVAWTLLTDEKIKTRNPKLALKFAQSAYEATDGRDPNVLDTYARALFDNGRVAEAVKQQQRAIELCDDKDRKVELSETLKRYQQQAGKP